MKHLKGIRPGLGDWVICRDNISRINDFVSSHIGRIEKLDIYIGELSAGIRWDYLVGYPDVRFGELPNNLKYDLNWCSNNDMDYIRNYPNRVFTYLEVEYWSSDRSDLELHLKAKKFNI